MQSADAPAIDPTVLAILAIFGGAALAGAATLLGAAIQARREHRRWLREKRYEAHLNILGLTDHHQRSKTRKGLPPEDPSVQRELTEAVSAIALLGPSALMELVYAVNGAQVAYLDALEDSGSRPGAESRDSSSRHAEVRAKRHDFLAARTKYINATRKAIGI